MRSSLKERPAAIFRSNVDEKKKDSKPKKDGLGWNQNATAEAKKKLKTKKDPRPPLYNPGPYQFRVLQALAYLVPIADAMDLGKYMFQAYPEISSSYNALFGGVAAIYNGVPFLPFALFFLLSYVSRAPTFPVGVRFHCAQAFMLSLIQFVPSLAFGLLEKAGVPGMAMAVAYNSGTNNNFHGLLTQI